MKTKIVTTRSDHDSIGSLQDEMAERFLRIACPPEGATDIVCIDPTDVRAGESRRFLCFWTGVKPEYRHSCPAGTKVAVEDNPVLERRLELFHKVQEKERLWRLLKSTSAQPQRLR